MNTSICQICQPQSSWGKRANSMWVRLLLLNCLTLFGVPVYAQDLQLQPVRNNFKHQVMINRLMELQSPAFEFDSLFSKEVYVQEGGKLKNSSECWANAPEIEFQVKDEYGFPDISDRPLLIDNFEDIFKSQSLLDMYYDQPRSMVFLMFQDATAFVITLNNYTIQEVKQMEVQGNVLQEEHLHIGYFVLVQGQPIFVNDMHAILVGPQSAVALQGYAKDQNFESAASVNSGEYLAVLNSQQGVAFYTLWNNPRTKTQELKLMHTIRANEFVFEMGGLHLVDLIEYQPTGEQWTEDRSGEENVTEHRMLFVLDQKDGLYKIDMVYNIDQDFVGAASISNIALPGNKQYCEFMYLFAYRLYIYCDQELSTIELRQFSHQSEDEDEDYADVELDGGSAAEMEISINVREIFEVGALTALVGRNEFQLFYQGQEVQYFQGEHIDKIIFAQAIYIKADERTVSIGQYSLIPPYVLCKFEHPTSRRDLLVRTTAECNQEFMDAAGFILPDGPVPDRCRFQIYQQVTVLNTREAQIKLAIVLSLSLFGITIIHVLLICGVEKFRLGRLMTQISMEHAELVEEQVQNSVHNDTGELREEIPSDPQTGEQPQTDEQLKDPSPK